MRNKYIFNKFFSFVTILIFIFSTFCTKVNAQSSLFRVERSTDIKSAKIGDTFDVKYKITPEDIATSQDNTQKDIVLVIDISGSMLWIPEKNQNPKGDNQKSRMNIIKEVSKKFINKFKGNEKINISVVDFYSKSNKGLELNNITSMEKVVDYIDKLSAGGATNIGDGLRIACNKFNNNDNDKYILLMTDGEANTATVYKSHRNLHYYMGNQVVGNNIETVEDHYSNFGYGLNYAKEIGKKLISPSNIKTFIVGFSVGASSNNEEIAKASGGTYKSALDENSINNVYDEIQKKIDSTIHGKAHFEESISSNIEVVNNSKLPYGLKVKDNKIVGDIDVEYTLEGSYYRAKPIEFTIKYKTKASGDSTLGKGGNSSFIDFTVSNKNERQYFNEIRFQTIGSPAVTIKVKDATGELDDPYIIDVSNDEKRFDKFLPNEVKLKGDSYADISFKSEEADLFQYKIMSYGENPVNININDLKEWKELKLNKESLNDDVIEEKKGYLCQRSYDVSHLQTIGGQNRWENSEEVFRYPFSATIQKSTKYSSKKEEYGKLEDYINYEGNISKRWVSNSVFLNNMTIGGEYKEASKFWGYIKVPSDGKYSFGALSDDGCRVYITANAETKMAVDNFKIQESTWSSTREEFNLKKDNFYPIYIEYSNWGGRADLRLKYNQGQLVTEKDSKLVPEDWFYPSKTLTPGEYGKTIFTGASGIKLPKEAGKYYIVYRSGISKENSNNEMKTVIREGFYGGFTVEAKSEFDAKRQLVNKYPKVGEELEIRYTITPKPIDIKSIYPNGDAPQNYKSTVTEFKYQDKFPEGIKAINKEENPIVINDQSVIKDLPDDIIYTKSKDGINYEAKPISFSLFVKADESKEYLLNGEDSIITYKDIDDAQRQKNFNDLTIELKNLSSILRQGVFTKNNPLNQYVYENNNGTINVVKGIKESAATIVDCKSKNPNIKVTINGNINEDEIVFKKYKLISGVMDTSSLQNFNGKKSDLKNGVELKSDKLTFDENQKYIIIYDITPGGNEGDQITIESKITDKQGDAKKTTLLINGLPDVH